MGLYENETKSLTIKNQTVENLLRFKANELELKPKPSDERVDQHSRHVESHPRCEIQPRSGPEQAICISSSSNSIKLNKLSYSFTIPFRVN